MKIIHTADIHLDSPLAGVNNSTTRRHELLTALSNLNEYASNNGVEAIIVAGDLFDEKFTTEQTIRSVADIVKSGKASWFVLRGNHGGAQAYEKLRKLCPEINFFDDSWTKYKHGNVVICGRELGTNDQEEWATLSLDKTSYNVLVLHGDVDDPAYGLIDKKSIAQSGAKYVALGHRHAFCPLKFGSVKGCYCGVLEARGFDETAETGFVEIDTDADKINFVTQAVRKVVTVTVDISGVTSDIALQNKIQNAVAEVSPRNYLNLILTGEAREDLHVEMVARELLDGRFFALRIKDATVLSIDIDKLSQEVSLRGEFVKLAGEIEDERLREAVLKMGLTYLSGEVKA
ncbi:MAG: metallophosphoesterase [Clostridiales bacterium]|nr:metallophosphoesterase [Clostridiales bacterium]